MSEADWTLPRKVNAGGDRPAVWRRGRLSRNPDPAQREVIVRVTGRARHPAALSAQLLYMTRRGDLPGEHSTGRILHGRDDLRRLQARWVADNAAYARHPSCHTQSVAVVLSMPTGTPVEAVAAATRLWAQMHMSGHTEWLSVQHTDRSHMHSHVAVRAVRLDGYRLTSTPAEIQAWRETFALALRAEGITADATPRRELAERALALAHDAPAQLRHRRL